MTIQPMVYDIESYPNYFMIGYSLCSPKYDSKGKQVGFTFKRHYVDTLNMDKLVKFLDRIYDLKDELVFVGFNNTGYDKIILQEAYQNRYDDESELTYKLFDLTQKVINDKVNRFKYNMFAQFDLQTMPSESLKGNAVIMHHNNIKELPYPPDTMLTSEMVNEVIKYNQDGDLHITEDLFNLHYQSFSATQSLIQHFNLKIVDFSKSDRQLTEMVLCDYNAVGNPTTTATYNCPIDIDFKDERLIKIKELYTGSTFKVGDTFKEVINYDGLEITFALGGLHGVKPKYFGKKLIDIDVASYYPNLIRRFDLLPNSVKDKQAYYQMIDDRILLKKTDPSKADAYKLVLNTVFGALLYRSLYSGKVGKLFDFEKFLQVTITGQLLIMKLVEDLTLAGFKVVYINTDGLMIEDNGDDGWKKIMRDWEMFTSLTLEENKVEFTYIKDVNNYILGIHNDGEETKIRSKGLFNLSLKSGPSLTTNFAKRRISIQAVINYVLNDTPIEDTIRESKDIRDFILHWKFGNQYINKEVDGKQLGKIVRWYISNSKRNSISALNSNTNSNYTPTFGRNVVIVDTLSDFDILPKDIDYDFYINEAYSLYKDLTGDNICGNIKASKMLDEVIKRLKLENYTVKENN